MICSAQAPRIGDDLVAGECAMLQEFLLLSVQLIVFGVRDEVIGGEEKTAGAAGGIGNALAGFGAHTFHHRPNERAWREVLAG